MIKIGAAASTLIEKNFEWLCNMKDDYGVWDAIELEAKANPKVGDGAFPFYRLCILTFQKLARQVAKKETLALLPQEINWLNEMLAFTPPRTRISFGDSGSVEVYTPSFTPEDVPFPVLSLCVLRLCGIIVGQGPYSLTTCGYVVSSKKPCEKIVLRHRRGRQRKTCPSHRTYKSRKKKEKNQCPK